MVCEICGGKTRVIVVVRDVDIVIRKRLCVVCGHTFYTQEIDIDYAEGNNLHKKLMRDAMRRYNEHGSTN